MLSISDRLAATRTEMANERTLLSYVRTALALAAAGIALVHVFSDPTIVLIGWLLVPVGALLLLFGTTRFRRGQRHVAAFLEARGDDQGRMAG